MHTIEAIYGVPDEEPVVQLFVKNGGQFGEVRCRHGRLELELWSPSDHPCVIDADELIYAIERAKSRLVEAREPS